MSVERSRGAVVQPHCACRRGPIRIIADKDSGIQGNRGQSFERSHFASVEIRSEDNPADQARRHDGRCNQLAGRPAEHCNPSEPPGIQRLPKRFGFASQAGVGQAMHMTVQRDDEGTFDAQSSGRIVERRFHGSRIAGRDRRAKSEVTGQQLCRSLKLSSALLPQAIVDRPARLELVLDLSGG